MSNLLFFLASVFFLVWILRNVLFWVSLWQTKEYRFDRLLVHFKETAKGKDLIFSPFFTLKLVIIVGFIIPTLYEYLVFPFDVLIFCVLSIDFLKVVKEVMQHRLRRPVFTLRAILIIILTLLTITLFFMTPLVERYLWLLLLSMSVPVFVTLFVYVFSVPSEIVKDFFIEKAKAKIQMYPKLLVIGVSGSYGKSSTKDYIAQVLSVKFNVAKTLQSNNTPIGIAKTVLSQVTKATELFVVEMGSYKKGEVDELCDIVHPKISVTTSISDQHLSLYGSFQNIIDTELELIHRIPKNGYSLLNGNNKYTNALFQSLRKKKVLYYTESNFSQKLRMSEKDDSICAFDIKAEKDGVSFSVELDKTAVSLKTFLLGTHTVENILPAIYLAKKLGMTTEQIKKGVSSLKPLPKTMMMHTAKSGFTFVDDTFNASPESVLAALSYMKIYKKKRYLVLEPMIELGKNAEIDHYKLGKEIGQICSVLYVTNDNFYKHIQKGIDDSGGKCELLAYSIPHIASDLMTRVKKDDIVVLEGREAGMIIPKIV